MNYSYGVSQQLEISAYISGLKHLKHGPVLGLVLDLDAQPPDFPWPFPKESLRVSGELPSQSWYELGSPFGPYFGLLWLIRLAKVGQSYQFHASFPASEVADTRPLSITGKVANAKGIDSLVISMRPAGQFRMENGDRITYRPPSLENFTTSPSLSDPSRLDITSFTPKPTSAGACPAKNIRATAIFDQDTIDSNGLVDPLYNIDRIRPSASRDSTLFWQDADGNELAPVASLINTDAQDNQTNRLWLAGGGLAILVVFTPFVSKQLWKSIAGRFQREQANSKSPTRTKAPQPKARKARQADARTPRPRQADARTPRPRTKTPQQDAESPRQADAEDATAQDQDAAAGRRVAAASRRQDATAQDQDAAAGRRVAAASRRQDATAQDQDASSRTPSRRGKQTPGRHGPGPRRRSRTPSRRGKQTPGRHGPGPRRRSRTPSRRGKQTPGRHGPGPRRRSRTPSRRGKQTPGRHGPGPRRRSRTPSRRGKQTPGRHGPGPRRRSRTPSRRGKQTPGRHGPGPRRRSRTPRSRQRMMETKYRTSVKAIGPKMAS